MHYDLNFGAAVTGNSILCLGSVRFHQTARTAEAAAPPSTMSTSMCMQRLPCGVRQPEKPRAESELDMNIRPLPQQVVFENTFVPATTRLAHPFLVESRTAQDSAERTTSTGS